MVVQGKHAVRSTPMSVIQSPGILLVCGGAAAIGNDIRVKFLGNQVP